MDFFADGGLQQLFSDLHDSSQVEMSYYTHTMDNYTAKYCEHNYKDDQLFTEKLVQESLDFLLSSTSSPNTLEEDDSLPSLLLINSELSDWEDKFLDNFIEIPELVDILPDETPLCTENCINFLQESSENLRLLTSKQAIVGDCNIKDSEKYYTCSFGECRKIYAKPAHLKAHLRRHMGEKPYVCTWPQCTWKFSRSDELSRHRRSHSGIKPYRCTFCSKCFARSDHLTKHRKVHERRLLAASKAGKPLSGILPSSILTVRPGRKKKNQL